MLYADQRWIGSHGIGRFAREVLSGLQYRAISLSSHPAAPFDAWKLSGALRAATSNDLFFSPGYNTPLFVASPFVFTIHDLSHVYCPENSSAFIRLYYATIMRRACQRAVRILTVSEFTRSQIVQWSGVPADKVVNVGCGVDSAYRPEGTDNQLPFPYLLAVSNRKLHKNEFRTLEAFAKAAIDPRIHLAFTGAPTEELANSMNRLGIASRVAFLGVVPEEQLPGIYRGALGTLFVSLYEGFGLPLLESMACGTAVITSNITAMPETAGDAALLVDPTATEQISRGIEMLVGDASLRSQLREEGLARAAQFSWSKTRSRVHELLTNL